MNSWFSSSYSTPRPKTTVVVEEEPTDALHVDQPTEQDRKDDRIDSYIASALGNLSLCERDKVYYELHGVDEVVKETPELVQTKLQELEVELHKLVSHEHLYNTKRKRWIHAYQLAQSQSPQYLQRPSFRLMFLRAERFDPAVAAERFLRFFDLKLYLFGSEKLCRDIKLQDLDKEDMKTLKAGFMQVLPARDRAGRAICMLLPNYQTYKEPNNFTRAMYYLMMSAMEDEETQKRGITCIVYSVAGEFVEGKTDLRTVSAGPWIARSLPFRMCSIHQCFNDPAVRVIINFSLRFLPERERARVKLHYGAHMECIYALMTYGISPDPLPVTVDGVLKLKNHAEWIKIRRYQEERMPPGTTRIVVPSQADVLFGRGKPYREHMGNLRLNNILDDKLELYEASRLKVKTAMIGDIVDTIRAEGGRFLKQDPHSPWIEVDDKQAKEKVSHGFRTRIKIASSSVGAGRSPATASLHSSTSIMSGNRRAYQQASSASETESITTSSPQESPMASPLYHPEDIGSTYDGDMEIIENAMKKRARM